MNETKPTACPAIDAAALAPLRSRVGKGQTLNDEVAAAPVRVLSATHDHNDPKPARSTELPPLPCRIGAGAFTGSGRWRSATRTTGTGVLPGGEKIVPLLGCPD